MQAIENEPPEPGTETPWIEQCRRQGRLRGFTPTPLDDQRERFRTLVRDMRRRGDTYTSQLGMLTLAGLNRRDPLSHHSILSDLLQRTDIKKQHAAELLLWQSRLIVKLGEFYDIEQAELHSALEAIARRQDSLLAELCDEEENPFVLPASRQNASQETDGILRHRLKAWTRLCFHGGHPAPGLLVTRHRTAMDLLQEVYEKGWRQSARQLASLDIPLVRTTSGQPSGFDELLRPRCASLGQLLEEITVGGSAVQFTEAKEQMLQTGLSEWSQSTGGLFSPPRTEYDVLELFLFPATTAPRLFAESFDPGAIPGRPATGENAVGCIVGLLTSA